MMSVCKSKQLERIMFATVAKIITINDQGILFVTFGHKKIITRQANAIKKEYQLIVEIEEI
jgi:hypothetical protein